MRRDYSIELYRILLMVGICVLHSATKCEHTNEYIANALSPCVVGFVFISGWYGIRFSVRKIINLYGLVLFASFVVTIVGWRYGLIDGNVSQFFARNFRRYWFVNSYVILLLMSPLINKAIDGFEIDAWKNTVSWKEIGPLLAMIYLWGFAGTIPFFCHIIPERAAPIPYSGYALLGIYAASRLTRLFLSSANNKSTAVIVFAIIVAELLCTLGLGNYCSPFSFIVGGGLFVLLKELRIERRIGRVISFITPSILVVYLMHDNLVGYRIMNSIENALQGHLNSFVVYVCTGSVVFIGSLFIDFARRVVLSTILILAQKIRIAKS